jgi:hypothetical protein
MTRLNPQPSTSTSPLDNPVEEVFQKDVIELAHTLGWRVAHFRPALTKHGWRTPVSADGKGFPDLILVRDRVIAVELKRRKGKASVEQLEWLDAFRAAGVEAYLWRPDDVDDIFEILRRRTP